MDIGLKKNKDRLDKKVDYDAFLVLLKVYKAQLRISKGQFDIFRAISMIRKITHPSLESQLLEARVKASFAYRKVLTPMDLLQSIGD